MNAGGSHRFEEALVSWKFTGPEGKRVGFVSPLSTASTFEAASFTAAHVGHGSILHSVLMESTSVSFLTCTSWLICFFFHQAKVH